MQLFIIHSIELQPYFTAGDYEVTGEDIKNMPYLKCCVQEALRMSSEGVIARKVVKDFNLMVCIGSECFKSLFTITTLTQS